MTLTAIAQQIGRSPSTVSPEVRRNSGLTGYRVIRADWFAQARTALGSAVPSWPARRSCAPWRRGVWLSGGPRSRSRVV